jgi:hypothetical protein
VRVWAAWRTAEVRSCKLHGTTHFLWARESPGCGTGYVALAESAALQARTTNINTTSREVKDAAATAGSVNLNPDCHPLSSPVSVSSDDLCAHVPPAALKNLHHPPQTPNPPPSRAFPPPPLTPPHPTPTPAPTFQILLVNMLTSVVLGMALAAEPAEPDVMDRPPRPAHKRLIGALPGGRPLAARHLSAPCEPAVQQGSRTAQDFRPSML